jgi:hypothetical protein
MGIKLHHVLILLCLFLRVDSLYGRDIKILLNAAPSFKQMSFHPLKEHTQQERYIKYFLLNPVVAIDDKQELRCLVCKGRPVFEKIISIVKKKILASFNLNSEIRWGDGKSITEEDFLFSFKVWKATVKTFFKYKKLNCFFDKANKKIVVESDDYQKLEKFASNFFLIPKGLEAPIWEKAKDNKEYFLNSNYTINPSNEGLFNGVWKISKVLNKQIKLSKSTNSKDKNKITNIVLSSMIDTKDVDIFPEILSRGKFKKIGKEDRYNFFSSTNSDYYHVIINHRNPKFLNNSIIKFLREMLREAFRDGLGKDYEETDLYPLYRNYLLEDRYKEASVWKCEDKKQSFELVLDAKIYSLLSFKKLMQAEECSGIKINLKVVSSSELKRILKRRKFSDGILIGVDLYHYGFDQSIDLHKVVPTGNNMYRGFNYSSLTGLDIFNLGRKLENLYKKNDQILTLEKIQNRCEEHKFMIPLFVGKKIAYIEKNIKNFILPSLSYPSSLLSDRWFYHKHTQRKQEKKTQVF